LRFGVPARVRGVLGGSSSVLPLLSAAGLLRPENHPTSPPAAPPAL
jgi:hypothetical protein